MTIYLTAANETYVNRWRDRIPGLLVIDAEKQELPEAVTKPTLVFNATQTLAERLGMSLDQHALEVVLVKLAHETPRELIAGPSSPSKAYRW